MARVAMAPGMFLAHSVVPSSGSTAMSTLKPAWVPTFSPMNSIGASSISPSPITTVPSIGRLPSSRRMASTAAWSDFFSAPRPRRCAAATAARSVTRAISIASTRSKIGFDVIVLPLQFGLVFLDPDHLRTARDYTGAADGGERLVYRIFACRIGNHDDRNRRSGPARLNALPDLVALHDRFQRNVLLGEPSRNGCCRARPVARQQSNIIAAFVMLHRRFAHRRHSRSRTPERRRTHTARNIGQIGH